MNCSSFLFYVFVLYMLMSFGQLALLWFPSECSSAERDCYGPAFDYSKQFISLCGQRGRWTTKLLEQPLLSNIIGFGGRVPLLPTTRSNGTLSVIALLSERGNRPIPPAAQTEITSLTRYMPVRYREATFLLDSLSSESRKNRSEENVDRIPGDGGDESSTRRSKEIKQIREQERLIALGVPVTHWIPTLKLRLVVDQRRYPQGNLPQDVPFRLVEGNKYLPLFYVDSMHVLRDHMNPLSANTSRADPFITLTYVPTSLGSHRILQQFKHSLQMMRRIGLSENETDEVFPVREKSLSSQILKIFAPDRIYRLTLTFIVSFLHTIFSFLAFKNEIGFWRGRESVSGLSQRAVVGNAVCSLIIFLFLLDSKGTSWLILGTSGASVLVDWWKVTKVLKWGNSSSSRTEEEKTTNEYDAVGMYYLSIVLYPLVALWAIYSLYVNPHRSWWSWFIGSAANGVYAFGFLMMTPQIFINYKMKSVAHLPWRAMTYKVFNTFVDDIFAWIIDMPTVHRIATLRDDLIFFIYLYQRWIYPVDLSRPNEYGFAYEGEGREKDGKEEKTKIE